MKSSLKFGVFLDSTVRMILRDSSCARVQFEEDREAYEIIEEESLQLEMKLAIKWWMSVYLNQKWQLLEWQLCIISWLFNQPNWMIFWYMINFILHSLLVFHVYIWNLLCCCLTICFVVILNVGARCYTYLAKIYHWHHRKWPACPLIEFILMYFLCSLGFWAKSTLF